MEKSMAQIVKASLEANMRRSQADLAMDQAEKESPIDNMDCSQTGFPRLYDKNEMN